MMSLRTVARTIVMLMCFLIAAGCDRKADQKGQTPAAETEQVKTSAEYKAEADKEITEQNMDQELDKLEKEVSAEADANQT